MKYKIRALHKTKIIQFRPVGNGPLSVPLAGADFTNTFRCLSQITCPTDEEGEEEEDQVKKATALLLEQCSTLEELKAANKPTMDPRWATHLWTLSITRLHQKTAIGYEEM